MKPKALDCCRNYSFGAACRDTNARTKLRCSQSRAFGFMCNDHVLRPCVARAAVLENSAGVPQNAATGLRNNPAVPRNNRIVPTS